MNSLDRSIGERVEGLSSVAARERSTVGPCANPALDDVAERGDGELHALLVKRVDEVGLHKEISFPDRIAQQRREISGTDVIEAKFAAVAEVVLDRPRC